MSTHQFEKCENVSEYLLKKYSSILPVDLLKLWKMEGFGNLLGGYLKMINPEEYQKLLEETYFRGNISIPIFITAFGDIITFEEGTYIGLVKYKNGTSSIIAYGFELFWKNLSDEYYTKKYLEISKYQNAVNILGKLEYEECFGYVPLLGLGGSEKVANLKKVKIKEHIELITQLVGKNGK